MSFGNPNSMTDLSEEFWRCLIADSVGKQSPAPSSYRDHCAAALFLAFRDHQSESLNYWTSLIYEAGGQVLACLRERDLLSSVRDDPTVLELVRMVSKLERYYSYQHTKAQWKLPDSWVRAERNQLLLGPPGDANTFLTEMAYKAVKTQMFFTRAHPVTQVRRMGMGPISAQLGDRVTFAKGINQIFLLREAGEHFHLIGECYVAGLMHGRAQQGIKTWNRISLI